MCGKTDGRKAKPGKSEDALLAKEAAAFGRHIKSGS
jgi:hypothetical protein